MPAPLAIAHVTPYAWEAPHDVNTFVDRASRELQARGHRVVVLAPSRSQKLIRESRKAIRAARDDPARLLDPGPDGEPRVLAVGEVVHMGRRVARRSLPVDLARTIEETMGIAPLDIVHVHEPYAPSASSAALRHSRALNVGTFHQPTERLLSTQVARPLVELVFGRLDARLASFQATAELLRRYFPADYRVLTPGAEPTAPREPASDGVPRIAYLSEEERPALRLFLRALRRVDTGLDWRATVWSPTGATTHPSLRRDVRDRVAFAGPEDATEGETLAAADIVVAASDGQMPRPTLLLRALAAHAVPVAARLPVYEEVLGEGEYGLLFERGDALTLAAQLERLLEEPALLEQLRETAETRRATLRWSRVVDELEEVYGRLAARRHPADGRPEIRARLHERPLIDVDLHMHTDHSPDCATPVEVLLARARDQGLGAIAITDHNEISGAVEAQEKAADFGVKVIIGEEVKTAEQGEVIGLFLTERIPRGLTLEETVAEIKRQGGLVYVPHPFDRLHSVPDYQNLLAIIDDVDAIEVFNPRVAISSFNEEAARFAAKYRIVAGAGSDAHVAQGLGSVRIRMRDFDGPEEFLESLRDADIVRKPASLVYVQALKFLETKATPAGVRETRRARRVARAKRKS